MRKALDVVSIGSTQVHAQGNLPITTFSNSSYHIRGSTRHNKVEEPLRRCRDCDVERTESRRGDFRDIDPAHRAPAELEEACEQEDADQRKVPGRRHGLAWHWRLDPDVQTDVEHCHGR
jgi:hypothetical protein